MALTEIVSKMQFLKPTVANRIAGLLLSAAGLTLVVLSIVWDDIRGGRTHYFGPQEFKALLTGGVLLAAGAWLFTTERNLAHLLRPPGIVKFGSWRLAASLAATGAMSLLVLVLPYDSLVVYASWIVWTYVLAVCLLLPARFGRLVFLTLVSVSVLLTAINTVKVLLTGLPLTMLDLTIAWRDPKGLWDALHLPTWTRYVVSGLLVAVALIVAISAVKAACRVLGALGNPGTLRTLSIRVAGIVLAVVTGGAFLDGLFDNLDSRDNAWSLQGVAAMAADIGVLPYLAYSRRVERSNTGDFFDESIGAEPPTDGEITEAIERYVMFSGPPRTGVEALPNIVILLAESTFDPNVAFRLEQEVKSELFSASANTVANGLLRVNVIGGGTWVSEFETLTGLDARLFGYSGYYAHGSLSPYVASTLATHLKAHGYHTSAFFPHDGDFYNYRRAYQAYGFAKISDSWDRGLADGWGQTDVQMVDDVVRILGAQPDEPLFSYVLLIENHGPHACERAPVGSASNGFRDSSDFEPNCALNEYLRRLRSTEAAVVRLVDYLRQLEIRSGRPYVLLVFGDHQPYSFTDAGAKFDFDALRTDTAKNVTFFKLLSSASNKLRCCFNEVPATLLPTLVSTLAARGPDDVYLGVNLWLHERCGLDAMGARTLGPISLTRQTGPTGDHGRAEGGRDADCARAYAQALTAYRKAGIMRMPASD